MNPEAISAMSAVIDALMSLGIPYYIGGSVASSAHGVVRSTLDADIIADMQSHLDGEVDPFLLICYFEGV